MNIYLGIDPGPTVSGICLYDPMTTQVLKAGVLETLSILDLLRKREWAEWSLTSASVIVEDIVSYGVTGKSTIETAVMIGRIMEASPSEPLRYARPNILGILCDNRRAKEGQAWDRLCEIHGCDRAGAKGRKGIPGRLEGVSSHARSALALCVVGAADRYRESELAKIVFQVGAK